MSEPEKQSERPSSARDVMQELACERGAVAAHCIAEHAEAVEVRRDPMGRFLFDCQVLGEWVTWAPDLHCWDDGDAAAEVLARLLANAEHSMRAMATFINRTRHAMRDLEAA